MFYIQERKEEEAMGLKPEQRLIVAADDHLTLSDDVSLPTVWIRAMIISLAEALKGTGVILKLGVALRACGYRLIKDIHDRGLGVFVDLRLAGTPEELSVMGSFLQRVQPEFVSVMCMAGVNAMQTLKSKLPLSGVLGITMFPGLNKVESKELYALETPGEVAELWADLAAKALLDGIICNYGEEVAWFRGRYGTLLLLTASATPAWANGGVIWTPARLLKDGADRVIVGNPITQASKPRVALERTLDEIVKAVS